MNTFILEREQTFSLNLHVWKRSKAHLVFDSLQSLELVMLKMSVSCRYSIQMFFHNVLLFFNSTSEDYFLTCWSLTASCQYSLSRQSRAKWRHSLIPGQEGHRQDIKAVQHLWPLHDFLMFSVVFLFYNLAAGQFTVHCCWSLIKELRLWANWLLTPSTGHSLGSPINILYMYCSCAKWRKPEQNSAVM